MSIKQVIVIRKDLNMRKGKQIAQGAHASMGFITGKLGHEIPEQRFSLSDEQLEWLENGTTKICVSVDSERELMAIYGAALNARLTTHLVIDSGRTEFKGVPTKTCVAIGPNKAEDIDAITGHLPLL